MLVPTFRRAAWLLSLPSFVTAVHCGSDAASPGASTDGGTTVPDAAIVDAQASDSGRDAGPDASRDGATTGDAATLPAAANVHLAAGGAHTCAILTGGVLKCWGYNGYGQLG
ncbi:MAG: hypothetical protein HOO96_25105, partial [Polyangiaceae bacterium]|nr:hypothetical protein [Polyangiaceae bacterium]